MGKYTTVLKICAGCGVSYWGEEISKYHSRQCSGVSKRNSIGTKKLHRCGGRLAWCIKTESGWRSLSVVLIEQMLGRKLSKSEITNKIRYIDGNPTNCTIDNLLLLDAGALLRTCQKCHKHCISESFYGKAQLKTDRCKECSISIRRILSDLQASCVKGVSDVSQVKLAEWFCVGTSTISHILAGRIYKEIEPMTKKEVWKTLLAQHDKLAAKATTILYDRVTLLVRVFEDEHYKAAMKEQGKSEYESLDLKLTDTCTNFSELNQILKMYPERDTWTTTSLSDMRKNLYEKLYNARADRLKEKLAKQKKEAGEAGDKEDNKDSSTTPKKPEYRRSATVAQVRELTEENNRLKEQLQSANQIIKSLENQLEGTRETIGTLNEALSLLKMNTKVKV